MGLIRIVIINLMNSKVELISSNKTEPSSELLEWYAQGNRITLQGHSLFYVVRGDKKLPTLLLIHGFPTASWDWYLMIKKLEHSFRIVTMDMLGFGFSDKPNNRNYSIHLQANLFEELLEQLQIRHFHILAHDYGDTVAQELLARQKENENQPTSGRIKWQCDSCCFLNGGLFPETHRALLTQKLLLSPIGKWFNQLMGKSKFNSAFSKVFGETTKPTAAELNDFWFLINYHQGKHLFHNLITYMNDRLEHRERWVNVLVDSSVPLALINGSADPVSGAHMVKRYKELGCRLDYLAELKSIGHYPQVETPVQVVEHYVKFIKKISE